MKDLLNPLGKICLLSLLASASFASTHGNQLATLQRQVKALNQRVEQLSKPASMKSAGHSHDHLLKVAMSHGFNIDDMDSTGAMFSMMEWRAEHADNAAPGVYWGGKIEADAQHWSANDEVVTHGNGSKLFVSAANLSFVANLSNWAAAHLTYQTADNSILTGGITFGDLSKYPVYLTAGRGYIPFGYFDGSAEAFTDHLNRAAFRMGQTDHLSVGYDKDGLRAALTVFNQTDATLTNRVGDSFNDIAASASYELPALYNVKTTVGLGYLKDIVGTTSELGSALAGTQRNNAAYDVHAIVNVADDLNINGEYTRTTKSRSTTENAKAAAWTLGADYTFNVQNHSVTASASYNRTAHMDNIALTLNSLNTGTQITGVESQWLFGVSTEVVSNVSVALEYAKIDTYSKKHASGLTLDITACV